MACRRVRARALDISIKRTISGARINGERRKGTLQREYDLGTGTERWLQGRRPSIRLSIAVRGTIHVYRRMSKNGCVCVFGGGRLTCLNSLLDRSEGGQRHVTRQVLTAENGHIISGSALSVYMVPGRRLLSSSPQSALRVRWLLTVAIVRWWTLSTVDDHNKTIKSV